MRVLVVGVCALVLVACHHGHSDAAKQRGDAPAVEGLGYLTAAQVAELRRADADVLAPTVLPEWARGVEVDVFTVRAHKGIRSGYSMTWHIPSTAGHPLTEEFGGDVSIRIDGDRRPGESLEPNHFSTRWGQQRTYLWSPNNDVCATDAEEPEGATPEADLFWQEGDMIYNVELSPGPACSRGHFTADDMIRFADSVVPIL